MTPLELDNTDRCILRELQKDARISNSDLAEKIGSSKTVCWNRTKNLIAEGYIKKFKAILDPKKIGLDVLVSVGVVLDRSNNESFSSFEAAIKKTPGILECLLLAGEYDYMLKIRVKDISSYNKLYAGSLTILPGVRQLRSFFVLNEIETDGNLTIAK